MNYTLFFAVFGILTLFYAILGYISSKNIKTTSDYFLGGRSLGLIPVTMTLIATQLGGGMLLGTSQEAYISGFYGLLYTFGMTAGFLILGFGLAGRMQVMGIETTAQLFETHYGSHALKKFASLLSMITLCGLLIAQIVASKSFINTLNIQNELLFIGFWFFVIAYTMIGGLKAVIITDIAQVGLIIAVFFGIFLYALSIDPWLFFDENRVIQQELFAFKPLSMNTIVATLIMPLLFSLIEQDLAQRFFGARTKAIARSAALFSAFFMLFFAIVPIYFGMSARLLNIQVPEGTSPLIPMVSYVSNEYVLIFALCAIIAAITSTADSLLCAISSNITQDFNLARTVKNPVSRAQTITLIIGIVALVASYFVPQNIIEILVGSYELSVSALLVPSIAAYFYSSLPARAARWSVVAGTLSFIGIFFWHTDYPKAVLPVCISLVAFIAGYYTSQD